MTRISEGSSKPGAESPVGVAGIALAALVFAGLGWLRHGTFGALLGVLAGVTGGIAVQAVVRARRIQQQLRDPELPGIAELPPGQALHVLAAVAGGSSGGPALRSELLERLDALRAAAVDDRAVAIAEVEVLRAAHPRSAAVDALLGELYRDDGRPATALEAETRAIARALDGGMNTLAHRIFTRIPAAERDSLALGPEHRLRLAAVLRARGETAAAAEIEAAHPN